MLLYVVCPRVHTALALCAATGQHEPLMRWYLPVEEAVCYHGNWITVQV
jgi:hypothetical protein